VSSQWKEKNISREMMEASNTIILLPTAKAR